MAFVQFSRVSLAFGNRDILDSVSLNLASQTKAALTGANGSGKTTLMKVLSGTIQCDSGERAVQKGTRISYLPQSGIVHSGRSLIDEIETAFSYGAGLNARLEEIGEILSTLGKDDPRTERLLEEHHEVHLALEECQWHRRLSLAEQTLDGLGFSPADHGRSVDEFSGGWQMRIALAKILLERPDIILLDEPTNYLDLEARSWLENWLRDFTGGFLIVSHDRYFLDVTVNEVYELFGGVLKRYPGNYSHYERVRAVELESLIKRYEEQREEISKTEDFIRRFRYNASKAAMVQDRIKRLEKMERIEIPENLKKIRFSFSPAPHTGRLVLTATALTKKYGERCVIGNLDLVLEKGERLVLVGRNGAGKSTLLRMLALEDTDCTGTIQYGAGVKSGYFSQDNAEVLTGSQSILELLEGEAPLELIPRLRDMLASFLFRGDDIYKEINVLSGGEKSRLALLRLLLRPINLLILDEPTNHLDLHSKDVLLEALKGFGGTVVFVSHDRGFIEQLSTRVLELTAQPVINGRPIESGRPAVGGRPVTDASIVRSFPGDYRYYVERLEREEAALAGETRPRENTAKTAAVLSREDDKRLKAERRKLEREEERLLIEIESLESKLAAARASLDDPEVYSHAEKSRAVHGEITSLEQSISTLSAQWESISLKLEELT